MMIITMAQQIWDEKPRISNELNKLGELKCWRQLYTSIKSSMVFSILVGSFCNLYQNQLPPTMDTQIQDLQPLYSSDEEDELQDHHHAQQPTLARGSSFKEYMFNLRYNIIHSNFVPFAGFQRKPIQLTADSQPAYLLGNCYNHTQMEEFFKHFRSTVWMSYRATHTKTDAGWGCTIRAMQMVLAEAIKRNNSSAQVDEVVQLFREGAKHPFSLDRICERGNINARWTGFNEIASIITSLLKQEARKTDPSRKLQLKIATEIFYGITTLHSKEKLDSDPNSFPRLVVFSNKIDDGNNHFDPSYLPHLQHLMKMSNFSGMVAGVSGEALFIAGFQDSLAIVLDPHYVQEVEGKNEEVFFKKTPRGLPMQKLSPNISICFFFKDFHEYKIWSGEICYAQRIYAPNVVTDLYASDSNQKIEQYRKRSQDFQIL